jgi:glycyl-tRNA synthetase alpha chain
VEAVWKEFALHEAEAKRLLDEFASLDNGPEKQRFPLLAAYDQVLKCSHLFNILDARGAISVTERVAVIQRVRTVAIGVAQAWMTQNQPSEVIA